MNQSSTKPPALRFNALRLLGWGGIVALVTLPAIAMQLTEEVNWTAADFLFAAILLGGVGLAFELAMRASASLAYRGGAAVALASGLFLIWVNAAVGIIGNEDEPINLLFHLVPLIALAGALAARFRTRGMARAMIVTAAAQIAVAVIAQYHGHFAWVFTAALTGAWSFSAWLFSQAGRVTS